MKIMGRERLVAAMAAAVALSGAAAAQQPDRGLLFDRSPLARAVPQDAGPSVGLRPTSDVAAGDFNGDGWTDLILARDGTTDMLWWGRGGGRFEIASPSEWPADDAATTSITLVDTDGDGDEDVLLPQHLAGVRHLENTGQGFTDTTAMRITEPLGIAWAIEPADLDGDGVPELILTSNFQAAQIWAQDSSGGYHDVSPVWLSGPPIFSTAVAVADFNGDNRPDVLVGNGLFHNTGTTLTPAQWIPVSQLSHLRCHRIADFNGDDIPDVVTGTSQGGDRLFFTEASGTLVEVSQGALPTGDTQTFDIAVADMDGDGDKDIVKATYRTHDVLLLNDGNGVFQVEKSPLWQEVLSCTGSRSLCVAHLNGDTRMDLVIGRGHPSSIASHDRVILNGPAGPVDINQPRAPTIGGSPRGLQTGDLDGDGDPDVVVSRSSGDLTVLWNHSGQLLADIGIQPIIGHDPQVADIDRDGRAELITRGSSGAIQVRRLTNGPDPLSATWTISGISMQHVNPGMLIADCNDDGWEDVIRTRMVGPGSYNLQLGVATSDGQGGFQPVMWHRALALADGRTLVQVDVNRDMRQDVAALSLDGTLSILRRGDGEFAHTAVVSPPGNRGFSLAAGDFNMDGFPDLYVGRESGDEVLLNNTVGGYLPCPSAIAGLPSFPTYGVTCGDLDGDGDLDLVRCHGYAAAMEVLENDGNGVFQPITSNRLPPTSGPSYHAAVFDVDMDGDLDLLRVSPGNTELWLNRTMQLTASGFPVAGQPIDLTLSVRPVQPPTLALAVLLVGRPISGYGYRHLDGMLRIDPADMMVHQVELLQYRSEHTWTLNVPAAWSHAMSVPLAAQAVVWEPMAGPLPRVSNVTMRRLLR